MIDRPENTPCIINPVALAACEAQCTRWTSINQGQSVKIYHDGSNWDANYYTNINEPDPIVYLQEAIGRWNDAYECGTLFELVDDQTEASVVVSYFEENPDNACLLGSALCACEEDDDICLRTSDHSSIFSPSFQSPVRMYFSPCILNSSENLWINVYVHEFGHILGMGHVAGLPVTSIMGNRDRESTVLPDFDIEQLNLRHPCGCNIITPLTDFYPPVEPMVSTADFCPGCMA